MELDFKTLVPWVLTLATIGIGIWQYVDKTAQANREPFLREQLRFAVETSEVVGRLATTTDADQWEKDRLRFWAIYYGPLAIFENNRVEADMVEAGKIVPRPGSPVPPLPYNVLQANALHLDHEFRKLILEAWRVDMADLGMKEVTK